MPLTASWHSHSVCHVSSNPIRVRAESFPSNVQDADDEDLPPLEEDVDEGSRMEVCCNPDWSAFRPEVLSQWLC